MNGIQVNLLEAREAGRCFWQYSYEVTSSKPLDSRAFLTLRSLGFLPNGQGFGFHQVLEGGKSAPVPEEIKWDTRVAPTSKVEVERGDGGTSLVPSYVYRVAIEIDSRD